MVMISLSVTTPAPTADVDPLALAVLGVFYVVFFVAAYVLTSLPLHGTYKKAGHPEVPAWSAWVPVYNVYTWCKLVGRPGWWTLLMFVPGVNVVVSIVLSYDLARSYGRGGGFTVGLVLLPVVFLFILWLGPSRYVGPAARVPEQASLR